MKWRPQPRTVLRRTFSQEQHFEALDNDADAQEAAIDALRSELRAGLDRIQWALIGLASTIIGSLVVYLITNNIGK